MNQTNNRPVKHDAIRRCGSGRGVGVAGPRGIATLELVLALPVMLTLVVALVWLGFSVVGKAQVAIEARNLAWQRRFENWDKSPLAFSDYQEHTETSDTTVEVSPLTDSLAPPTSEHTIEQANWDHRSIEYRPLPNWRLYADTAIAAGREGIASNYRDARSAFAQMQSLGSGALAEALARAAQDLTSPGRQFDAEGESTERRAELDEQLDEQRRRTRIADLRREIATQKVRIDSLRDGEDESDEALLWLAEKKLERLETTLDWLRSTS